MESKLQRIRRKLSSFYPVFKGHGNISFSQFGEDVIMLKMLERYGVDNITYLDIGANDPVNGSNTYSFYLRGYRGVLIEPNAALCYKIRKQRPGDTCLNFGIGIDKATEADYYMFSEACSGMNTFSKEEALSYEQQGFKIEKVVKLPLRDINEVLAQYFKKPPTIMSIDVEGLDEMILSKMDFERYQPLLVCVESVTFSVKGAFEKRKSMLGLLQSKGYFIYADTNVNTIFCSTRLFNELVG
jgi:hypothetical protein